MVLWVTFVLCHLNWNDCTLVHENKETRTLFSFGSLKSYRYHSGQDVRLNAAVTSVLCKLSWTKLSWTWPSAIVPVTHAFLRCTCRPKNWGFYDMVRHLLCYAYRFRSECEAVVKGFAGSRYKKFSTYEEAEEFSRGQAVTAYSLKKAKKRPFRKLYLLLNCVQSFCFWVCCFWRMKREGFATQ